MTKIQIGFVVILLFAIITIAGYVLFRVAVDDVAKSAAGVVDKRILAEQETYVLWEGTRYLHRICLDGIEVYAVYTANGAALLYRRNLEGHLVGCEERG